MAVFSCLNLQRYTHKTTRLRRYLAFILLSLLTVSSCYAQQRKFHFVENKMGSPFNLILVHTDSFQAVQLAKECFMLIDSFNHIFSDYDSTSELSRLCAQADNRYQTASPALWDILVQSKKAWQQSKGAFDITVSPLSRLWRRMRRENRFPDSSEVLMQKKRVGFGLLTIDTLQHRIRFNKQSMQLDLGGIAKGYVAQAVIDYLATKGVHSALADAGGDMAMSGSPPGTKGWIVGVNVPETTDELLTTKLLLHNMAVATSGDAYQFIEHNGRKYSHIIDPRTGYGISSQRNVTVIAKDGATADWLATACSIASIIEAKQLVKKMGAELLITEIRNNRVVYYDTPGFGRYWK